MLGVGGQFPSSFGMGSPRMNASSAARGTSRCFPTRIDCSCLVVVSRLTCATEQCKCSATSSRVSRWYGSGVFTRAWYVAGQTSVRRNSTAAAGV